MNRADVDAIMIRPLGEDDAPAFKALRLKAIQDSPSAVQPTYEEEATRTLDDMRSRVRATEHEIVFGAFRGDALVGVTGLRRHVPVQAAHKAVLWGVFVDPAHRRGGVARRLLDAAIGHARSSRVLQIQLCVNTENPRAQALYRGAGFTEFGVEPRALCVGGRFYDEAHMVLWLDAGGLLKTSGC
ncbi:GNAT family N-acetyltransferase [Ralstonia solanacearum]|uniref:GNAT family N-acetyltransferase n=1 Tax=Ralstonia solanacearum TaxID=305 RepID=UPI0018D006C6|nr:GNAT family N-acetyltransferase [Ralstonia solanacearum]MDB0526861.1 GNAT family N-acetyltransferase [Ralstonia solanacearum]